MSQQQQEEMGEEEMQQQQQMQQVARLFPAPILQAPSPASAQGNAQRAR